MNGLESPADARFDALQLQNYRYASLLLLFKMMNTPKDPLNPAPRFNSPTQKEARYRYVAHQINREDGLVNYRLTWMLQINGFLFAALAALTVMDSKDSKNEILQSFVLCALPLTGFAVSFASLIGVIAAMFQLRYLVKFWEDDNKYNMENLEWPRPFGNWFTRKLGLAPKLVLPVILSCLWLILMDKLDFYLCYQETSRRLFVIWQSFLR